MSWVDTEIEKSASPIEVDASSLGLTGEDGKAIATIDVLPLSAAEYQTLKSDPELKGLSTEDKQEILGLKLVHLMMLLATTVKSRRFYASRRLSRM